MRNREIRASYTEHTISGNAVGKYVNEWSVNITDITSYVNHSWSVFDSYK